LKYRTREGIVADLLAAATHSDGDGEGVGIATIIRKGNMPYSRAVEMLHNLVKAGLLSELSVAGKTRYAVTDDGFRYIATYRDFEGFARSFGLRL
jgi:predicted transcriptional regulator